MIKRKYNTHTCLTALEAVSVRILDALKCRVNLNSRKICQHTYDKYRGFIFPITFNNNENTNENDD